MPEITFYPYAGKCHGKIVRKGWEDVRDVRISDCTRMRAT